MGSHPKSPGVTLGADTPQGPIAAEPRTNVERVRKLIATGRYEVDLELLAARILAADPHGDGT